MSAAPIRLSVLDQSPVIYGHSARDAIAATVDLAQLTDALGYTRYWCAEHHGLRGVSNPAPEVMIARVASATKHLRVGSGGVMLPYYSRSRWSEWPTWYSLYVVFLSTARRNFVECLRSGDVPSAIHFSQRDSRSKE